jgi:hypothetical protein
MLDWFDPLNPWHVVGIPLACGVAGWLAFGFGIYGAMRLVDWLWPAKTPDQEIEKEIR